MIAFRIVCLGLAAVVVPAAAQNRTPAEGAAYQGADRTARLIEGAKREGTLSLYTSRVAEDTNSVIDAFAKKYGIDVSVWRAANRTALMSPTEMLDNGKKWTALWEKTVIRPQ